MRAAYTLISFLGFLSFHFLAIYVGEQGKIGFAIGYATLAVSFIIALFSNLVFQKLKDNKSEGEIKN